MLHIKREIYFILIVILTISFISGPVIGEEAPPNIEWQRCIGGTWTDWGYHGKLLLSADGGYYISATTFSSDGDFFQTNSQNVLIKVNDSGSIEWIKSINGFPYDAILLENGKVLLYGYTSNNIWISEYYVNGEISREKTIGDQYTDIGFDISQTRDGGLICIGLTNGGSWSEIWAMKLDNNWEILWKTSITVDPGLIPSDVEVGVDELETGDFKIYAYHHHERNGYYYPNPLIAKLNSDGAILWKYEYGGTEYDDRLKPNSYISLSNGNSIYTTWTRSNDGNVSFNHGDEDLWVVETDPDGNILWEKTYGGSDSDAGVAIFQKDDGGYLVAGYSTSLDGDLFEINYQSQIPDMEENGNFIWILSINSQGRIDSQRCYGGTDGAGLIKIRETIDGNYLFCGSVGSDGNDVVGTHGGTDIWIVKISPDCEILWQKCLGGSGSDLAVDIQDIGNFEYIVVGTTSSNDGDIIGNHGGDDIWVVKLNSTVLIEPPTIISINPSTITTGSDSFTLELTGTNFVDGAKVLWDGQERATIFVSTTKLTVTILKEDVTNPGTYKVKVVNPDGKASGEVNFEAILGSNDTKLNVPLYSQTDPSWASDILGTGTGTVGNYGCALTSTAMVFSYFSDQVTPKELNQWLIDNNGYVNNDWIDWTKAADYNSDIVYKGRFDYNGLPEDVILIKAEIDSGNPVIANVRYTAGGLIESNHFVVLTGYGTDTFYINDPADGTERTLADSRYATTSGQRIFSIRIYHRADDVELQTPLPISPGTRTPPGTRVTTLTPLFSWQGIPSAEGYRLYISECDENGEIINPLIFVTPSLSDSSGSAIFGNEYNDLTSGTLEWGKKYCWNIEPKIDGDWSRRYSPLNYFTTDSNLQQAINRERIFSEDLIVTVGTQQYIIATLENKLDPETLETIPDSGRTTIYLNMAGEPVSDGFIAQRIGLIEDARSISFDFDSRITNLQLYDAGSTGVDKVIMTKGMIGKIVTLDKAFQTSKIYWDWYDDEVWQVGITDLQRLQEAAKYAPKEGILVKLAAYAIEKGCGNPYAEAKEDLHHYLSRSIENYESASVVNNKEINDDGTAFAFLYNVYYGRHFEEVSHYLVKNIYLNSEVFLIEFEPVSKVLSSKIPSMSLIEFPKLVEKAFLGVKWQLDTGMLDITGTYKTNADLEYKLSESAEYSLRMASAVQEIDYYRIKHAEKVAAGSQLASEAADATVDYLMGVDIFQIVLEIKNWVEYIVQFIIHSPGEPRIYDSYGRVTGLINGEIREEIPESEFNPEDNTILIFNATDSYHYEVYGTDEGYYGLSLFFVNNVSLQNLEFSNINISNNSIHKYSFDLNALINEDKCIYINKDSNGDGIFENSVVTTKPYIPSMPTPENLSINVSLSPELKWKGGDPDPEKELTYSIYFGENETPQLKSIIGPISSEQEYISSNLDSLDFKTAYYWYVVVRDEFGITEVSPLWNFTTASTQQVTIFGNATLYGNPAPVGSHVTATAAVIYQSVIIDSSGWYGESEIGKELVLSGDIPTGTPITFKIGGLPARCGIVNEAGTAWFDSYPFFPNSAIHLDLDVPATITADFSGTPTTGYAPLEVMFRDNSTGDPFEREWDFGDGSKSGSNQITNNHTFTTPGTYSICLKTTRASSSDTETKNDYITVTARPQPPIADFTATPRSGPAPLAVKFSDNSTGEPDTCFWNFGDGKTSSDKNPVHTYSKKGLYSITLTVENEGGTDLIRKSGYIIVEGPIKPLPWLKKPPRDVDGDGTYEDLNGDGKVNQQDLMLFVRYFYWIQRNEPASAFDFNHDGRFDFWDYFGLLQYVIKPRR